MYFCIFFNVQFLSSAVKFNHYILSRSLLASVIDSTPTNKTTCSTFPMPDPLQCVALVYLEVSWYLSLALQAIISFCFLIEH